MFKGRHNVIGFMGMLGLILLYFVILTFSNLFTGQTIGESFGHATSQFGEMWYLVLILSAGFGTQVGLYSHIRSSTHKSMKGATAEVAASGGVSTVSMAACCAHHIVDVLPLLGLSAAAIFMAKYQTPFIILGIFSNLIGITMMLNIIQKHHLYKEGSKFRPIFNFNMKTAFNAAIVLSLIVVSSSFAYAAFGNTETAVAEERGIEIDLPEITKEANAVTVSVTPVDFSFYNQVSFKISFNTHSVDLGFDLTKISLLEDGNGNRYEPSEWQGSAAGGHHRSGTLVFPMLKGNPQSIKLIIKGVSDTPVRIFEWSLSGSSSAA
ncbi:MAG: hypothetical protein V3S46_06080 [Nitrospinota bacterium]